MNPDFKIKFSNLFKIICMVLFIGISYSVNSQTTTEKAKNIKPTTTEKNTSTLPHLVFFQLIDSTVKFEVNHSTEFKHIDLPGKFYNQFTAFIKDSAAAEVAGLKSIIYYNYTLKNGSVINGDIYWNETNSYIVFLIDGKKYVNHYNREGVQQLKTLFKL
jgi:hypothetical protein